MSGRPPNPNNNPNYRDRRGQPRYKPAPVPTRTLRAQAPSPEPASNYSASPTPDSAQDRQDGQFATSLHGQVGAASHQSSSPSQPTFSTPPKLANRRIVSQSAPTRRGASAAAARRRRSMASPKREASVPASSIPTKRAFEDDHQPAVSSPLNPDSGQPQRNVRAKKESLKKRESKGTSLPSERATPDPKLKSKADVHALPFRYKLAPPLPGDFRASNGPYLQPTGKYITLPGREEVDPTKEPEGSIELYSTSDHAHNKRHFRYQRAIADPAFPSNQYYRETETEPLGPRASFEDSSEDILFDETGTTVTTAKGWRMARANVCAREGRHFFEVKILKGLPKMDLSLAPDEMWKGPSVRMGWARREAALDMSVGYGPYSYGLRDRKGRKVWITRDTDFFPNGEDIREGDVIGLEIYLPSLQFHKKIVTGNYNPAVDLTDDAMNDPTNIESPDINRDRVPIRYKNHLYFEQVDVQPVKELDQLKFAHPIIPGTLDCGIDTLVAELTPTNPNPVFRTLPTSYIRVYKNGIDMGKAFENLLAFLPPASKTTSGVAVPEPSLDCDDGMIGYFPAISVMRGSIAKFNLGPDFDFPPLGFETNQDEEVDMVGNDQAPVQTSGGVRPMSDRFDEQICEDIMADILDEVSNFMDDQANGFSGAKTSLPVSHTDPGQIDGAGDVEAQGGEIKELVQDE